VSAVVRQQALTVVVPIAEGGAPALVKLLEDRREATEAALSRVTTLHFGRFVVLPPEGEDDPRGFKFAFESNFDGELGPHLDELWAHAGHQLQEFLRACSGSSSGPRSEQQFARFVADHSLASRAFFVACPGLSAERVRADARLRAAIHEYLDRNAPSLAGAPPRDIVEGLRSFLRGRIQAGAAFDLSHVERGLTDKTGTFWQVALLYPFELAFAVVRGLFFELADYLRARRRPPELSSAKIRARLDEVAKREHHGDQNGLTHLVPLKGGSFRRRTLKLALRLAQELALRGSRRGRLGELDSIHFARWIILDDGRLLFFGNYDGSWDACLGDFIERAAAGLSMIWSNTRDFPPTFGLFFGGARDEERFKRWARAHQHPTQIWYSAYPELSVREVLVNAELREILAGDLGPASVQRFCELC
jgi:hypothetical protein